MTGIQMTITDFIPDPGSWYGKTCLEHSPQTKAKTSKPSSRKSSASSSRTLPMFLYLTRGGGQNRDVSWVTERTDVRFPSLGDYMMHSFGEYPNEGNESQLSEILEDSPQAKYSLSEKACTGILRRAKERNKPLPPELEAALLEQIKGAETNPTETISFLERAGKPGGGKGILVTHEKVGTLSTCDIHRVLRGGYYPIEHHPMDSREKLDESGIVQTLNERMGTGGNNIPLVLKHDSIQQSKE